MTNTLVKAFIPFNEVYVSFNGLSSVDIRLMGLDEEVFNSGQRWFGIGLRGFILGVEEIDGNFFYVCQAYQVDHPLENVEYAVDYKLYIPTDTNYMIPLQSPSSAFECYTEKDCLGAMHLAVDTGDRELFDFYSDILSKIRSL